MYWKCIRLVTNHITFPLCFLASKKVFFVWKTFFFKCINDSSFLLFNKITRTKSILFQQSFCTFEAYTLFFFCCLKILIDQIASYFSKMISKVSSSLLNDDNRLLYTHTHSKLWIFTPWYTVIYSQCNTTALSALH